MGELVIHRVTTLDLAVEAWSWPFARERRAEIDGHFAAEQRRNPALWNGRILLGRNPAFEGERFGAGYFETDFASFLAWRDWGFPDTKVFNGFGVGALLSSDGAFALGEMAQQTANAGRVYFPSGMPDLDDIRDGTLDIAGNVARELQEETGLAPADYRDGARWHCFLDGPVVAMVKVLRVDMSGAALRARIVGNLALQPSPELSDIHLVRGRADLTDAMPRYVTGFLEAWFSSQP